jgi:REP element-mobilizing transposase RayT
VFSTKERRPWLSPEVRERLFAYLGGIIRNDKGFSLIVGGTEDHVHILAHLHQSRAVSDRLRDLKAKSSKWVHETFPAMREFAWQGGYGAFTVSTSQTTRVHEYIAGQEEHHRKEDFKTEFLRLLKAHGIEYDERYIWE